MQEIGQTSMRQMRQMRHFLRVPARFLHRTEQSVNNPINPDNSQLSISENIAGVTDATANRLF